MTIFIGQFVGQLGFLVVTAAILIVDDFKLACPFVSVSDGVGSDKAVVGFETVPEGGFAKAHWRWWIGARHVLWGGGGW